MRQTEWAFSLVTTKSGNSCVLDRSLLTTSRRTMSTKKDQEEADEDIGDRQVRVEHIEPDAEGPRKSKGGDLETLFAPRETVDENGEELPNAVLLNQALEQMKTAFSQPDYVSKRVELSKVLSLFQAEEFVEQYNAVLVAIATLDEVLGDFQAARDKLQRVIKSNEERLRPHWQPFYLLGKISAKQGQVEQALVEFGQAADYGPLCLDEGDIDWTESLYLRALLLYQRGRTAEARTDLSKALLDKPLQLDCLYLRATILLEAKESFDAIKDFGLILTEDDASIQAQVGRAVAYLQLQRPAMAKQDLFRASKADKPAALAALLSYSHCLPDHSSAAHQLLQQRLHLLSRNLDPFDDAASFVSDQLPLFEQLFQDFLQELSSSTLSTSSSTTSSSTSSS